MAKAKKITTEGIGDKISKITKALGISECEGCKKRKELLNSLFPTEQALEMTPDELAAFAEVKDKRELNNTNLLMLESLYFKTFQIKNTKPICRSCPKIWVDLIAKLQKVYDIQITNQDEPTE